MKQTSIALLIATLVAATLSGCASKSSVKPSSSTRPGAYYKDDGPPAALPTELERIADAEPRDEALHRFANRPYNVFGVNYTPMTTLSPLTQRGIASWYGRKFHGQKTATGETYDMFAMGAAHPTAPLPSFARVTNVRNGKSVIVRVNDRGPFHSGRIVDLSYAAAHRIGTAQSGSGEVEFELLMPPTFRGATTSATAALRNPVVEFAAAPPRQSSGNNDNFAVAAPSATAPLNRGETLFFVQLGAFGNFGNAQAFQRRMGNELGMDAVVKQANGLFRVQLGPFATETLAQNARSGAHARLGGAAATLPITSEKAAP
jgi:rare lipoprotein A